MKILVISDTQLGSRFNRRKYDFLKRIIMNSDKVIINGDFWEGYETTFDKFVKSPWSGLFPLLKERKTVYLYGNHDKKEYSDKRVNLFSVEQGIQYKLKSGDKTFYFEHGHRITPFTDKYFKRAPKFLSLAWTLIEHIMTKLTGMWFIGLFYKKFNERIKKYAVGRFRNNEILICGHTSVPYFDVYSHYINGGWIKHGIAQYLLIEEGKVKAYDERY